MRLFGRETRTWLTGTGLVGALGLAAGLFAAAPAQAQSSMPDPGTYDITPFLGLTFGAGDDALNSLDLSGSSLVVGGAFAYNWTTTLAFEGELGILPDVAGDNDALDVKVTTLSGNVLYHFDTGTNIVPYATVGLGFGRTSFDLDNGPDDANTELAVNFGGGVKADVAHNLQVRGDLRYFNINDENPNFWRLYGGVVFRIRR
jgi:opacity protein-like surface antigen